MNYSSTVSSNVRILRNDKDMTQEDLAYTADLSVSHLSKVERGITSPTVKTLQRLADALNVGITSFFAT